MISATVPVRTSRAQRKVTPNPAFDRTGRHAASTWRASARPAGWLARRGSHHEQEAATRCHQSER